jgi:hypothetical protein
VLGGDGMYKNIDVELARLGWNKKRLSLQTGIAYNTLLAKLAGSYPFTLDECFLIKDVLNPELTVEYLFEERRR